MSACSVCRKPLSRGNRSGLCLKHFNESPEYLRRRREAIQRSYDQHPERRESRRQHMLRIRHLSMTPESIAKRDYATMARERGERIMAWCPPAYRAAYRRLVRAHHFAAAEARTLILDQIRKDMGTADKLAQAIKLQFVAFANDNGLSLDEARARLVG